MCWRSCTLSLCKERIKKSQCQKDTYFGNDIAVYPGISLHEIINWNPTILHIKGANTMFIIVFIMILIVATKINIVFTKIGCVLKHRKYAWGQLLYHCTYICLQGCYCFTIFAQ